MFNGMRVHVLPEQAVQVADALFPGRFDSIDLLTSSLSDQNLRQMIAIASARGVQAAVEFASKRRIRRRLRVVINR